MNHRILITLFLTAISSTIPSHTAHALITKNAARSLLTSQHYRHCARGVTRDPMTTVTKSIFPRTKKLIIQMPCIQNPVPLTIEEGPSSVVQLTALESVGRMLRVEQSEATCSITLRLHHVSVRQIEQVNQSQKTTLEDSLWWHYDSSH